MADQPSARASVETLAAAMEREHHEIDGGIEAFLAGRKAGEAPADPLIDAISALRRHIYLEERFLFPTLREHGLFAPILAMYRQHGEIWDTTDSVEEALGKAAAADLDEGLCRTLLEQLAHHNMMEEAVVYPEADTVLHSKAGPELRAFLQAGQMPGGWRCKQAAPRLA